MKTHHERLDWYAILPLALVVVVVAGCATGPVRVDDAVESGAISPIRTRDSALGSLLDDGLARHPGRSGFRPLDTGAEGLRARILLADAAEHSLDMQYYIWEGDRSSQLLGQRVLRAAERGVRVRLLLDDFYLGGERDFTIGAVSSHPNIEVRIFNPLRRRGGAVARNTELVTRVGRLKHRMHNKIFAADNQVAIVGGRNVGDVYFGLAKDYNYRDLGLLCAGPIVAELSASFDAYWNSDWAIPIEALHGSLPDQQEAEAMFEGIRLGVSAIALPDSPAETARARIELLSGLVWADARLAVDLPDKAGGDARESVDRALVEVLEATRREVLFVSPYLMPIDKDLGALRQLLERGVAVRILSNSLASTDVVLTQVAYANHRPRMLAEGIALFELRADAKRRHHYAAGGEAPDRLSLHAKAAVFDRRYVYIGSFNLDRYGAKINTEIGVIVQSPELAEAVLALLEPDLLPTNSWRVVAGETRGWFGPSTRWIGEDASEEVVYERPPDVGAGRRFEAWFLGLFPIR